MSAIPDLWHPETVYLNTASFGLPPDPVWDALTRGAGGLARTGASAGSTGPR